MWAQVNSVLGRQEVKQVTKPSLSLDMINDHFQTISVTNKHRSTTEYELSSHSTASSPSLIVFPEISATCFASLVIIGYHLRQLVLMAYLLVFYRKYLYEIVEPLTVLHNESLQTGVILLDWKRSHITLVHKGGSADDATNYKPTSKCTCPIVQVLSKQHDHTLSTTIRLIVSNTSSPHALDLVRK